MVTSKDERGLVVPGKSDGKILTDARNRAKQLLGMNEPVFDALVDHSIAAFALEEVSFSATGEVVDAQVVYANAAHERFSGIPHATAIGGWITQLLPDLDETWLLTAAQALQSGAMLDYRMAAPGDAGWFDGYFFPVTSTVIGSCFTRHEALPESDPLQTGSPAGLTIDTQARTAKVGDQELALTRTEFDVLAMLVQSPGVALNSRDIIETVTGDKWLPTDRKKLAVHVHNLRRKLNEKGFAGYRITTVMGFGYRLDPEDEDSPNG